MSPKDGAGITGLRLFCSTVTEGIVQPHKRTKKILEFPGSFGDWGQILACQDGQWVTRFELRYATDTEIPLEHLGVVQIRLRCNSNPHGKEATFEGIVTPYGQKSGKKGALRTEDPTLWQHNLNKENLKPWVIARQCPEQTYIMGAKVQTDQNDRNLRVLSEGINPDMVGINNVKVACNIYGKTTILGISFQKKCFQCVQGKWIRFSPSGLILNTMMESVRMKRTRFQQVARSSCPSEATSFSAFMTAKKKDFVTSVDASMIQRATDATVIPVKP